MHALPPVPTAIAFRTPSAGLLGTSSSIELTRNGGRTWKVVFRTPRPVASLSFDDDGRPRAILDDGENLGAADGGRRWTPELALGPRFSPCPPALSIPVFSDHWVLCTGQGGAGNAGKAVYRFTASGAKRVAYTPFAPGRGYGGISVYGYADGISMAHDGFGIIWEARGTLYVTRDGGRHWIGLPRVAVPETDFGIAGAALRHGVGFVVLARGDVHRRLLVTRDHGRTWHVVHRWR